MKKLLFVLAFSFASLAGAADYIYPVNPLQVSAYAAQFYAPHYVGHYVFNDSIKFTVANAGDTTFTVLGETKRVYQNCGSRYCRPTFLGSFITVLTSTQVTAADGTFWGIPLGTATVIALTPGDYVLTISGIGSGIAGTVAAYAGAGSYIPIIQGAAPPPVCYTTDGVVYPCDQPPPAD